jgi:hypothetical protein
MYIILEFYADGEFRGICGVYPTLRSAEIIVQYLTEENPNNGIYFEIHDAVMCDDVEEE